MGYDLITIDDFKAYKLLTENNKNDPALATIISGVSAYVKSYCGRSFVDYYNNAKVEYLDGTQLNELMLSEFPIQSIVSVETSTDGTTYEPYTNFFLNGDLDSIMTSDDLPFVSRYAKPKRLSVRVTYKAGFKTIPEDLKLAVMDLVEYYRKEKSTPRKSMDGTTIENTGFRAGTSNKLPPNIARILEMYKNG